MLHYKGSDVPRRSAARRSTGRLPISPPAIGGAPATIIVTGKVRSAIRQEPRPPPFLGSVTERPAPAAAHIVALFATESQGGPRQIHRARGRISRATARQERVGGRASPCLPPTPELHGLLLRNRSRP